MERGGCGGQDEMLMMLGSTVRIVPVIRFVLTRHGLL
jgi:hypothetical protein